MIAPHLAYRDIYKIGAPVTDQQCKQGSANVVLCMFLMASQCTAMELLHTMSLVRRREASLTFLRTSRRDFMTSGACMRASIVS